jgi:hypothetical protein
MAFPLLVVVLVVSPTIIREVGNALLILTYWLKVWLRLCRAALLHLIFVNFCHDFHVRPSVNPTDVICSGRRGLSPALRIIGLYPEPTLCHGSATMYNPTARTVRDAQITAGSLPYYIVQTAAAVKKRIVILIVIQILKRK